MCDYSLHLVASRPAKIGDKLVTTKFNNTLTGGFAGVQEPTVAVCLLPGTEVAFEREVECENVFKPSGEKPIRQKVARFRQINLEQPNVHHDALEFPDGQVVKLTQLCEGQHATVLQLPASPRATNEAEQRSAVLSLRDRAARYRACLAVGTIEKSHRGADGSALPREAPSVEGNPS